MKTENLFRKVTSALLAVLMIFTTFMGTATKVHAATVSVKLINYPRAADTSKTGNWGHPYLHLANGWFLKDENMWAIFTVEGYTGKIAYCFEPSTPTQTGVTMTQYSESYWDNFTPINNLLSADDIKLYIGRIMQYGYSGNVSTSWYQNNETSMNYLCQAWATQMLIWETVVGERDSDFNYVRGTAPNRVMDAVTTANPLYSRIWAFYDDIVRKVQSHTSTPSFMSKSTGKAQTVEMKWDGEKYVAELIDTNNILGNYSFSSSDSSLSFAVNGNKLIISATKAPTTPVRITANKNNAARKGIIVYGDGLYNTSRNGHQDLLTFSAEVSDPVRAYLNVKVSAGSANIIKTSEDGRVGNIEFNISGPNMNKTVYTAADGTINVPGLEPGIYTITEKSYEQYKPQSSQTVEIVAGQTSTVSFNNSMKRGSVEVVKSSEDNFVDGVKFHLFGVSVSGDSVDTYATTGTDGIAKFNDILIGQYTLEEVDTNIRYVIPEQQSVTVKWDEVTNSSVTNKLKKFKVTVTKTDIETTSPQGDGTLSGAAYGIYKDNVLLDTYYTDDNGIFTTKEYICGDGYTLKEISPSEGYKLNTESISIGSNPGNFKIEHNSLSYNVVEGAIYGNISIIKHTDEEVTMNEIFEKDAVFQIYHKASGSYDAAKETERDILTTDENGYAESKYMPYGTYTVHQISGMEGRDLHEDFDVVISSDGNTYRYILNNPIFTSYLRIVKKDAETGNVIPVAGSAFKIFGPDGSPITMTVTYPETKLIDTFYTDASGKLTTPGKLTYGKGYSIVEVQAPYGYVLDSTPVYFDVNESDSNTDLVTYIEIEKSDMAQKGVISVTKYGEVFADIKTDENNIMYKPVYEIKPLKNAVFNIIAAEDITTPDGTVRYSANDVVDTITTGDEGIATSKELYLGKYTVVESQAPEGYVFEDHSQTVELIYAGQEISVIENFASVTDERQKCQLDFSKSIETNDTFGTGKNGERMSVTFGLYANEDLISYNGNIIPADGLIEIITLNENGTGSVHTDLPFGKYYVKEITTHPSYIIDENKYEFEFSYSDPELKVLSLSINNNEPLVNKIIYGSVSGIKVGEDGTSLAGAVFGLFDTDTTEFCEENAYLTSVSNSDGAFSFENVPYGSYFVREIVAPEKYTLNETNYLVEIKSNGTTVEIYAEDTLIRGNIQLTKVDRDYPENKLTGATFEVYDENEQLIGEMLEIEEGIYEIDNLTYGEYFVKETAAPDGFVLDENTYTVNITENGKTYIVENESGKGCFINSPKVGSLLVKKTSSDGAKAGFSFRITGPNNYDKTFITDKDGFIRIDDLRLGSYTVSEIRDSASSKYHPTSPQTVDISENNVITVSFYNEEKDIPNTGVDTHTGVYAACSVISAVGIAVILYLKKKEKNN